MLTNLAREKFQGLLLAVARPLAVAGISPSLITIAGFFATLVIALLLALGQFLVGGLLLIPISLLDSLDGAVARLTDRGSPRGAFLDSTLDRYSEIALFGGLLNFYATQGDILGITLTFLALTGSLMVSYTRARAEGLGFEAREIGILTRFERFVVLVGGLILSMLDARLLIAALFILAIGSHLTALQRMWHVHRMSKK